MSDAGDLDRIREYCRDHPDADTRDILEALELEHTRPTVAAVEMAKSTDSGRVEGGSRDENPTLSTDKPGSARPDRDGTGDHGDRAGADGKPISQADGNDTENLSSANNRTTNTPDSADPGDSGGRRCSTSSSDNATCPEPRAHGRPPRFAAWRDVDFSSTDSGTYPPALLERERWMGRLAGTKTTFAPWGDPDHPDADADEDARYKWGIADNYADGEAVAIAEDDPRLDGRVFIQREDDQFTHVDGDDVRCPETDAVHPAFIAILEHLGLTYADVSTSGSGIHAHYTGELPIDGKTQATIELDTEPWGANEDVPSVEFHAGKRLCVTTGEHVDGTPLELVEWDHDALRCILEVHGYQDKPDVSHDTDRDRVELEAHEPTATGRNETTDDVRDVLAAVDRLRPRDLPLKSRQTGEEATGWETWDPSYRASESGESVQRPPGESVFYDHKEGEAFGLLGLFAAEQGLLSKPWDRLEGVEWWEAVKASREAGAPIPEYVGDRPTPDAEPTAVLPPAVRDLTTAASGFDWKHAGRNTELTTEAVRDRTTEAIADAYDRGDRVLVEVLPTGGKTYGALLAAAETDTPITFLTGRGRTEQYDQLKEWCRELGLRAKVLPSMPRDCPTAAGDHGEAVQDDVMSWYNRGATPKQIHKHAEYARGEPLPCQVDDEGRHIGCPYAHRWEFDPDEYDVIIGHYTHAYKREGVTTGRTVVFDEFPDAFELGLDHRLEAAVSYWLKSTDGVPFDDYADLLEGRHDEGRRADALLWFDDHDLGDLEAALDVFADGDAHAAAPLAALTLLAGEDLGNGFETAALEDVGTGVFHRETGTVNILRPPPLEYATGVVCLDGTPTRELWELAIGGRLNHRQVLQDGERAEYLTEALNLNLVGTTEYVKPYNSADHVHLDEDAALLEAIGEKHDKKPALITTRTAADEYDAAGLLELERNEHGTPTGGVLDGPAAQLKWFGDVLGSNELGDVRLGAVIGSNHYGDDYIKKWGAYAGEAVERGEGKGAELSYGSFGDRILEHMRDHDTLQAAMRFGRDGNGAVVYVHTDTLPDWVPLAGEGRVVDTRSDGERQVLTAAQDLEQWRTAELAEHPAVDVGQRRVFDILNDLAERGVVTREYDGRGYTWRDDGLHEVSEHGEADLETVDLAELPTDAVAEVCRNSIYTWEFRNPASSAGAAGADSPGTPSSPAPTPADGTGPPPDPPD